MRSFSGGGADGTRAESRGVVGMEGRLPDVASPTPSRARPPATPLLGCIAVVPPSSACGAAHGGRLARPFHMCLLRCRGTSVFFLEGQCQPAGQHRTAPREACRRQTTHCRRNSMASFSGGPRLRQRETERAPGCPSKGHACRAVPRQVERFHRCRQGGARRRYSRWVWSVSHWCEHRHIPAQTQWPHDCAVRWRGATCAGLTTPPLEVRFSQHPHLGEEVSTRGATCVARAACAESTRHPVRHRDLSVTCRGAAEPPSWFFFSGGRVDSTLADSLPLVCGRG